MKRTRVGIIGGGASGMMAAIQAAGCGADVTILEKKDRIGKKLLATGNGKCNLSNLSFSGKEYNSSDPFLLRRYFQQFGVKDTVRFFEESGMLLTDRDGYLYPRSGQAAAVLDLLRFRLEAEGVTVRTGCQIQRITGKKGAFTAAVSDSGGRQQLSFDRIVLACGTPAGEKPGEGMDGYGLAQAFGHHLIPPLPALVQLRCKGSYFKALAGVRCDASCQVRIVDPRGKKAPVCLTERGEVQMTDYGISGIPVFQFSRHAARALAEQKPVEVSLDFLPDFSKESWLFFCKKRLARQSGQPAEQFFAGMLHKKLTAVLLKRAGIRPEEIITKERETQARRVFDLMREFPVEVTETNPFSQAQVCSGGIPLPEVDEHLQSRLVPGLYLTGELLDVDGRCGGYNLQWAWTSGSIAGMACAGGRGENVD